MNAKLQCQMMTFIKSKCVLDCWIHLYNHTVNECLSIQTCTSVAVSGDAIIMACSCHGLFSREFYHSDTCQSQVVSCN